MWGDFGEERVSSGFDFFFQAEDGIRDDLVTGVQTCALPILGAVGLGSPVERHPTTTSDKLQSPAAKTIARVDMALKCRPQRQCRDPTCHRSDTNRRSHHTLRWPAR